MKVNKIILSLVVIGAVAAIAVGGTIAFFTDTETSTGNTFAAGTLDLKIDDNCTYNGETIGSCVWQEKDLENEVFFNYNDVKPGDEGENTVSLHVYNNNAYVCAEISDLTNDDNGCNEPEGLVDGTCGENEGELQENVLFTVWKDNGTGDGEKCNNNLDGGELVLVNDQPATNGFWPLYDSQTGGPLEGDTDACIGISWRVPAEVENEIQSDSMSATVTFSAVQSRNNDGFVCGGAQEPQEPERTTLGLENKDVNWGEIVGDGTYGTLTFISSHPTFDYTLDVYGLVADTDYSIIYYADPWPGNHPGALIGTLHTNGSGNASVAGDIELGIDLPDSADANAPGGAKIWVVRSSEYTPNSISTWPLSPETLFEHNLVQYDDSNN